MTERKRVIKRVEIPPEEPEPTKGRTFHVYTDGACMPNPGRGGWAWIIDGGYMKDSGKEKQTTNQRMEMTAVIRAITDLRFFGRPIVVYTDSQYISNCFRDQWYVRWERNGWRNAQRKPVANDDLWRVLIPLVVGQDVEIVWVRGHDGNWWNEEADRLAGLAAR